MDYETAVSARVSLSEVSAELSRHGFTLDQARADGLKLRAGKDGLYSGRAVLEWLGY